MSYLWLCLYVVNIISHSPWDYYVFMWLMVDFALICIVVGSTILFLVPSTRKKALDVEPVYLHRHRRPAGVEADEMLAKLVEIRRSGRNGVISHKEMQHVS